MRFRVIAAAACIVAVAVAASATEAELRAVAEANGLVRVIIKIRLDEPFVPEGHLRQEERDRQRDNIRGVQDLVKGRSLLARPNEVKRFATIPFLTASADVEDLLRLASDPDVEYVAEDGYGTTGLTHTPGIVQATGSWAAGFSGTGQIIAVLDTGIQASHPFLTNKVVYEACFSETNEPLSISSLCPNGGPVARGTGTGAACPEAVAGCHHGTHVAGIAAGKGSTFSGIARDASIMAIQIFHRRDAPADCSPGPAPCARYSFSDLAAALDDLAVLYDTYPVAAVNMSLQDGNRWFSRAACDAFPAYGAIKEAVGNLVSLKVAVVGITGNYQWADSITGPGCLSDIVSVGATTKASAVPTFSNSSGFLDLLAPGDGFASNSGVFSSVPSDDFDALWGTSMAAPHVAGAFAILRQRSPLATVGKLKSDLVMTGQPVLDSKNGVTKPLIRILDALARADTTPPSTPAGFQATASGISAELQWNASTDDYGIQHYRVQQRLSLAEAWSDLQTTTSTSKMVGGITPNVTYQYRVIAVDTSGNESAPSPAEIATSFSFTDPVLTVGSSQMRAVHLLELRSAIDAVRQSATLSTGQWSGAVQSGAIVRASDVSELRTKLSEALNQIGVAFPAFTDAVLTAGASLIRAVHVSELRARTN